MKRILFFAFVMSVLLTGCVGGILGPSEAPASQPSPTPVTVVVTATTLPTEPATAILPAASPFPTFTSTPLPVADNGTSGCQNHGVMAWQNDNMSSGQTYGLAPVGGLSESCWVVGQTHWLESDGKGNVFEVRGVFAVEPNTVAWITGYLGGTGWYFGGSELEVRANLAQQAAELEARDGEMMTYVIVLPEDAESFPILDHVQTSP